jgi:hypothetical protein
MNIIINADRNTCRYIIITSIITFLNNPNKIITLISFIIGIYGFLMLYKCLEIEDIKKAFAAKIIINHLTDQLNTEFNKELNKKSNINNKIKQPFDCLQKMNIYEKYGPIMHYNDNADGYYKILSLLHLMNYLININNNYFNEEDTKIYSEYMNIIEKIYQQSNNNDYVKKMLEIIDNKNAEINIDQIKQKYSDIILKKIDEIIIA